MIIDVIVDGNNGFALLDTGSTFFLIQHSSFETVKQPAAQLQLKLLHQFALAHGSLKSTLRYPHLQLQVAS